MKDALTTELKGDSFKATLRHGFHFNEKAPNTLRLDSKRFTPTNISARAMEFRSLPEKWVNGQASVYVCDDALTFCEPVQISLGEGTTKSTAIASATPARAAKINRYGFIDNNYAHALGKLNKQKLLLIDFSAKWCPGCVRLENEIFTTKQFKNLTRDFVKVKLDVDLFENRELIEKFQVKGIPALLIVNADQEEIGRVVDYQPIDTYAAFIRSVQEDSTPLEKLDAKNKDVNVARRLGLRLFFANHFEDSIPYLSLVKPEPPELISAQIRVADNLYKKSPETKAAYTKVLRDAIAREPESSRSISWREDLVGLIDDKNEIAKIRAEGEALTNALLADPVRLKKSLVGEHIGEFAGLEPMMIAMSGASLVASAKAPDDEVDAAWKKAADAAAKLKISADREGPATRYLMILNRAKLFAEADKLARSLKQKNPANIDIECRHVRSLVGLKKYSEAIEIGKKCLAASYGRNEFWAVESLARAYSEANQKADAKELLEKYLSRDELKLAFLRPVKENLERLKKEFSL